MRQILNKEYENVTDEGGFLVSRKISRVKE